ncbi:MAG TPA: YihY/virulence factor BrkB family protein [Bacteroidia bacterium]|nr:YihY/virulence factor BrkB family protein [Sphingobacteriales bacterium]HPD64557.1 YihY/virulence factor BrkB family protein [Bacteroidia bacterium]HRS58313.1 YihY/virulence factor BrkB family protein [Bacteroidia bacterium]
MKKISLKNIIDQQYQALRQTKFAAFLRKIPFPLSGKVPMTEVIKIFYQKMVKESISQRAYAIAFSFFLALFPGLIFVFSLIPYFPVPDLADEIKQMLHEFLPESAFEMLWDTIEDIILVRRGKLLSLGVVLAIYFSSNGINTLLLALKKDLPRHWMMRYVVAFFLTIILVLMILISLCVQITGEIIISYFSDSFFFSGTSLIPLVWGLKLFVTLFTAIFSISLLYFYGTHKSERFRFFSPGAFLSTIMIGVISYGFGFYVENFNSYNKFYGSLGAIIVLMMWLYFSALSLISGYELNQSVYKAKVSGNNQLKNDKEEIIS